MEKKEDASKKDDDKAIGRVRSDASLSLTSSDDDQTKSKLNSWLQGGGAGAGAGTTSSPSGVTSAPAAAPAAAPSPPPIPPAHSQGTTNGEAKVAVSWPPRSPVMQSSRIGVPPPPPSTLPGSNTRSGSDDDLLLGESIGDSESIGENESIGDTMPAGVLKSPKSESATSKTVPPSAAPNGPRVQSPRGHNRNVSWGDQQLLVGELPSLVLPAAAAEASSPSPKSSPAPNEVFTPPLSPSEPSRPTSTVKLGDILKVNPLETEAETLILKVGFCC